MNKYGWLFLSIILVLLITVISQEIAGLQASAVDNQLPSDIAFGGTGLYGYLSTYYGLLTFNVAGVPAVVSLFFIPLNLVIGVIILEYILKGIDVIIPF